MPQILSRWVLLRAESSLYRRFVSRRYYAAVPTKSPLLAPLVIGLGIWIGFPTVAAYQDMASMVSGTEANSQRWNGFVEK